MFENRGLTVVALVEVANLRGKKSKTQPENFEKWLTSKHERIRSEGSVTVTF